MNREIEFRAYSTETGMVEICDNSKITLEYNKISGWNIIPNIPNYKGEYLLGQSQSKTNDFILMQFTGLKDKNGVKIYEGDILDTKWVISFKDGMFGIFNQNTYMGFNAYMAQFREVIGNIYENKNLINEKL